ncbi:hydrogenase maturation protein [Bradyrhizobium sediminis]|uniref:Hydrogenase maturation protein n=1 Tax=Bradyrhizobium sediminis TaxID=2840469 RepID=A0A975P1A4_9BRAD|nr:enoyl-CoA hydratase-related protein [Bradyrhizobium sediminis]QWG24790.1 hydrogenase maturation protein [Bradyrhizobium sediminis]
MRILLLTHAFNSLAQRLFVELRERGHDVTVELDINDAVTREAVELAGPDLVIAPFLKRAIAESVWRRVPCFIVHPGIRGDRGPSSLDWAILDPETSWGVTVLQAEAEMDAGPVWASCEFPMRDAAKSSLYRNEVTEAATAAVLEAVDRFVNGGFTPQRVDPAAAGVRGRQRPAMSQADRAIDWSSDTTARVLAKIRSGDGNPGVRDRLFDRMVHLYNAKAAMGLGGPPGSVVAWSGPAIARATIDGAVWIGHLREPAGEHPFKLPATHLLAREVAGLPAVPVDAPTGFGEIAYREAGAVGMLHFDFYNGAMGTEATRRLLAAYLMATRRPTKVIVLLGGAEFWSNGMDLNLIEAARSPADESWANINALDDLAEAIVRTRSHLTIAALGGNAGAGGVFLARTADLVWLREGVVLNPHYKDMGNLFGSELWTYLLPRRAGLAAARNVTEARLPVGASEAVALGLADDSIAGARASFTRAVMARAEALAAAPDWSARIAGKARLRDADEADKPLALYRAEELEHMRRNFYGFDPSYHVARSNFVRKVAKSRTPITIARHRDRRCLFPRRMAS